MRALILAAFISFGLGAGTSFASADVGAYQAPAHNYYQNNWMSS